MTSSSVGITTTLIFESGSERTASFPPNVSSLTLLSILIPSASLILSNTNSRYSGAFSPIPALNIIRSHPPSLTNYCPIKSATLLPQSFIAKSES